MNQKSAPKHPRKKPDVHPRRDTVLKVSLCTLVCLWMFVLGLLVGRGTAPVRFDVERLQDKLADLKAATVDETTEHYRVAFQELDQEMDLGFHEALKVEETEIPATMSTETTRKQSEPKRAETSDEKPEASVPKKTKDPALRKPESESADTWIIQVAATKDEAQGKKLLLNLIEMGFKAYLTKVDFTDKGTWYRVRIGGYTSREAAESDMGQLEEKRFSPMIIAP